MKKVLLILGCMLGCFGCATTQTSDLFPYEPATKSETTADAIQDILSSAAGAVTGGMIGSQVSDSKAAPVVGAYVGGEMFRGMSRWQTSKRTAKWEQGFEAGKRAERLALLSKMQPGQMTAEKEEGTSEYMAKQRVLKRIPNLEIDGVKYDSYYKEVPILQ